MASRKGREEEGEGDDRKDGDGDGEGPLLLLLDNSNIWIGGMQVYAWQHSVRDPAARPDRRFRVDTGRLLGIMVHGRENRVPRRDALPAPLSPASLFGSIPPPTDSVWRAAEERGWTVDVSERSRLTGREKGVDLKIGAHIVHAAVSLQCPTVVIASGDADFADTVGQYLRICEHLNVEFWSWEFQLSGRISELAAEFGQRCEIVLLDSRIDEFGFVETRFLLPWDQIKRSRAIVVPNYGQLDPAVLNAWLVDNEFPLYDRMVPRTQDLVFQLTFNVHPDVFTEWFHDAQEALGADNVQTVVDYCQQRGHDMGDVAAMDAFNRYELLAALDVELPRAATAAAAAAGPAPAPGGDGLGDEGKTDADGFTPVDYTTTRRGARSMRHTRERRRVGAEVCRYGLTCKGRNQRTGMLCQRRHPRDWDPHRPMIPRKTIACSRVGDPRHSADFCGFLHPGELPLCVFCGKTHAPWEGDVRTGERPPCLVLRGD